MKGPALVSAEEIRIWLDVSPWILRRRYMAHPLWPAATTPPRIPFEDRRWYETEVVSAVDRIRESWAKGK